MLTNAHIHPVVAVKSLETAQKFYEEELGLEKLSENPGGIYYKAGNGRLFVYVSQFAGSNKATVASWEIEDVYSAVDELRERGVVFERYTDLPDVTLDGDVHVMGPMMAAWFKDPDGNVLCISNMV